MNKPQKSREAKPAGADATPSVDYVRSLAEIVEAHGLTRIKLKLSHGTIILERGQPGATQIQVAAPVPPAVAAPVPAAAPAAGQPAPAATPAAAVAESDNHTIIHSPFVGTFYRAPSPGAPPFVEVGQRVQKGQVLCIIEAMKLMNEIESEVDGVIVACLVENAQPVEYNQPLFKIAPA